MALLGAALLAFSCNKDSLFQSPVKDGTGENAKEIRGLFSLNDGNKIELSHLGGSMQVSFTTGESWTLKGYDDTVSDWLSVSPTSGRLGTTIITIQTGPNVKENHIANLQIVKKDSQSADGELASFSVSQPVIVFDIDKGNVDEPFLWNDFVRTRDSKGTPIFMGDKGLKTVKINCNIGWKVEYDGQNDASWLCFDKPGVSSLESRADDLKLLPADKNFTEFKQLTARIVPMKPKGDDWVRLQELPYVELNLSQNVFLFRTEWQGDTESGGVKYLGNLPYSIVTEAEKSAHIASFTVRSESDWEVKQCPAWLQLWSNAEATKKLTDHVSANPDGDVTVWVTTRYANPHTMARSAKSETGLILSPLAPDAEGETLTLPVNQTPFVYELSYKGEAIREKTYNIDAFQSGDTQKRILGINATGVVDDKWIFGDTNDWLACEVDAAGQQFNFGIAEGRQNLQFSPISAPITIRPPKDWFDPAITDAIDMQTQLKFQQDAFVFDLKGWDDDSYLNEIGNKSTAKTTVTVECTGDWSVTVSYPATAVTKDWVTDDQGVFSIREYDAGKTDFRLGAVGSNPEMVKRYATLEFVSKTHFNANRMDIAGSKITKTITQNEYQFKILDKKGGSVISDLGKIPAYKKEGIEFFLNCSGAWKLTHCPAFLQPSMSENNNDDEEFAETIHFDVVTNLQKDVEYNDEYVEITPKSEGKTPLKLQVSQNKFIFDVIPPATNELPAYSGGVVSLGSVSLTPGVKWQLSRDGSVVSGFSNRIAKGNNEPLNISLPVNLDEEEKQVTYTLAVTEPTGIDPQQLHFSQKPFIWNVTAGSENKLEWDSAVNTTSQPIVVSCSGPWKLMWGNSEVAKTGSALDGWRFDWAGTGEQVTVNVTPSQNDSWEPHQTDIYVVSTKHLEASRDDRKTKVTLIQPKFELAMLTDQNEWNFQAWNTQDEEKEQESDDISVTSTAGWTVDISKDDSWVSADQSESSFKLVVKNNTSGKREATLKLRSTEKGITSCYRSFIVRQEGFVFKASGLENNTVHFPAAGGGKDVTIECSASWQVDTKPDAFVTDLSKKDEKTLHIEVAKSSEEQSGQEKTIRLVCHGQELNIKVIQDEK